MKFIFYGVDFGHKSGAFCKRQALNCHFISFFRTDFLYESGGNLLRGRAGDMLIHERGDIVYHGPTEDMKGGFRNDWVYVEGEDFIDTVKKYSLPIGEPFGVGGRHLLANCIEKIRDELSYGRAGYVELCELYMHECILQIHRARIEECGTSVSGRLAALRGELAREPKREWTLAAMAEFCGYSESRFFALYKKKYSVSPISDLIRMRIENAKALLEYGGTSVGDVAEAVGFSSVYYFSRCFKRCVGITPTEYKKGCLG